LKPMSFSESIDVPYLLKLTKFSKNEYVNKAIVFIRTLFMAQI
jgi:hypothetical protein